MSFCGGTLDFDTPSCRSVFFDAEKADMPEF